MRTTLSIDDELLAAAKRRAQSQGLTLGQVVEAALRRELALTGPAGAPRPEVPVFTGAGGVVEGIDLTSNRSISEALDEGRDLAELR